MYSVPAGSEVTVLDGPQQADNAPWWRVRYVSSFGNPFVGWVAEKTAQGTHSCWPRRRPLLPPPPTPTPVAYANACAAYTDAWPPTRRLCRQRQRRPARR